MSVVRELRLEDHLPENWLEILKLEYPKRGGQGWLIAQKLILKLIAEGNSWGSLIEAARDYRAHCDREELTGTCYVLMAKTFYGIHGWWQEDWKPQVKPKTSLEIALERRWEKALQRANTVGFRKPYPTIESIDAYETALATHENRIVAPVVQLRKQA